MSTSSILLLFFRKPKCYCVEIRFLKSSWRECYFRPGIKGTQRNSIILCMKWNRHIFWVYCEQITRVKGITFEWNFLFIISVLWEHFSALHYDYRYLSESEELDWVCKNRKFGSWFMTGGNHDALQKKALSLLTCFYVLCIDIALFFYSKKWKQ